ncbi:50S ribosomal protein L10 [Saccharospirillum salsuginis]|uniref:Large ribosomal subunit protein uL10 n=1 Tax=Saccharospirillum salsuginis TaxID=418750 RepID=A0A918KW79_9GAMM|nr:50S ribosomal protein L10 [Saccharospirillum salsuginis]GGX76067.1 50S ribosomal protein L10 [Saccharospirillum salsuginis]
MALNLEDKKLIVSEVKDVAANALSLVIADARGVTVADMDNLRKQAREQKIYMRVVKNSLAKRAFEGSEYEVANAALTGPTLLAFSMEDPGAAARLLKDFAKNTEPFEVKALSVGGELLGAEQIDRLAKLPTRDEALGMLANVTLAPVTKLARTLNEVPSSITRVMAAVADKKKEAA